MKRFARGLAAFGLAVSLLSCASDEPGSPSGVPIALRDPLEIVPGIEGELRLFVLPAEAYTCTSATGTVAPALPDMLGAPPPGDAVVDVSFGVMEAQTVDVPEGNYTILVRGWGTDIVSMRMNAVIATGCATEMIGVGETREISIELHQVIGEGVCGDGILSPDEQCDDRNTTPGDLCDATCRTERYPFSVNTTTMLAQTRPAIAWQQGTRGVVGWLSETSFRFRYLDENGLLICPTCPSVMPSFLQVDADVEALPGLESDPAIALNGPRVGFGWGIGTGDAGDVRGRFYNLERMMADPGMSPSVLMDPTGRQANPGMGMMPDGTAMLVYEHARSPSGLGGTVYASGSFMPASTDAFVVGMGSTLAVEPAVAGHNAGFTVAFSAGGDVFVERFDASGASLGAAVNVIGGPDAAAQNQPDVAAFLDGTSMVVWRDAGGQDGAGSAIRGRVFAADGTPAGDPFVVNSTGAGDQTVPAVTAGFDRFVAVWQDGAASVRARLFNTMGIPALNREPDPSDDDFVVAATGAVTPDVAAGGAAPGAYVVVWSDTTATLPMTDSLGDIAARRFPLP